MKTLILASEITIDFLFLSKTDFIAKKKSPADIDHWPYEECLVIHDPMELIKNQLPLIIAMPFEIRNQRLKLHYFEFLFAAKRVKKTLQRGDELNTRLVATQSVLMAIQLIFILRYRWPPVIHWFSQNFMEVENIPFNLKTQMLEIIKQPNSNAIDNFIHQIDKLLAKENFPYVFLKNNLACEVAGFEFRSIREKYGSL